MGKITHVSDWMDSKTSEYLDTAEGEKYKENTVWRQLRDGKLEPVSVVTGVTDGVQTEIIEGLEAGDRVVTGTRLVSKNGPQGEFKQPQGGGNNPFMPRPPQQGDNKRTE